MKPAIPPKKRAPAKKAQASAAPARSPRPGGQATRQHLLETAGQVFAERGLAEGTTKEIAQRAGTPMASINYHFGSREGLYEAVLIEAHRQILSLDELLAVTQNPDATPHDKLRTVLGRVLGMSAGRGVPWGYRVMVREVFSPSALLPVMVEKAVRPKAAAMRGLMAQVLGLPDTHPAVQRGVAFVVLPAIMMLVAPRESLLRVLPALAQDPQGLQEDLIRYVMAGLDALAAAHRSAPASKSRAATARRRA
ncbi:CerR family C-terminal domain-containing protein [Variovorax sp. OV329]|uniref:CerR family C-terminal domain-containing protein n=1 Tax=Variovorax sp. OV329 TaxID=1882825 RepID=UPI0008E34967|nr:CerR family C-terminal domain-containing protein [Variovorax sp. OV329]SFM62689.1 transcriptional regulator, TetR family [Variovorax sp. OV329]